MKTLLIGQGLVLQALLTPQGALGKRLHNVVGAVADEKSLSLTAESQNYHPKSFVRLPEKDHSDTRLASLITSLTPDVVLSVQYPWKIGQEVISLARNRIVNVHNARLPDYRGHGTISHEILAGEKSHFVSVHLIDNRIDFGRLLMEKSIPIHPTDTAIRLWEKSVEVIDSLVSELFENVEAWIKDSSEVQQGGKFYSVRALEPLKVVTTEMSADQIGRIARAFYFPPFEPAHLLTGKEKIYLVPGAHIDTLSSPKL
jgi:methionyl-tRNA formyltransferase